MQTVFSSNMHCAACKANIETALKKLDGVIEVNANLVNNVVKVTYNEKKLDEKSIIECCKNIGYKLEVIEEDSAFEEKKSFKKEIIKLISGILLIIPLMFFSMSDMYESIIPAFLKEPIWLLPVIELAISIGIISLYFGYYIRGFRSLIKLSPNMDSLIFLGSFFSLIYSIYFIIQLIISPNNFYIYSSQFATGKIMFHTYLDGAAMILVFVSIGKLIEDLSKRKARSTIAELLKLRPTSATLIVENETKIVETKFLKVGDRIIVKPGESIPLDGEILEGETAIDESLISGESLPIYKKEGDEVIGGSLNVEGTIVVLITKNKKDNVLSKIISLMMEASNMDTKLTRKVDKVAKIFVPFVLILSVVVFLIWLIVDLSKGSITLHHHFNSIFDEAFSFGISLLVVSCPCALGLATPISLLVGSSVFAKNGILVNKSETIESLKDIDVLVLDKTNTITEGKLTVNDYLLINTDKMIIDRIYSIEKYSSHPLSEGICEVLKDKYELKKDFKLVTNVAGKGVKGVYEDLTIFVGNEQLLKDKFESEVPNEILNKLETYKKEGTLAIIVFSKNEIYGIFSLKDKIKSNAKDFIIEAKKHFKRIVLLTGDNEKIAKNVASEVGIDEVISDVKPEDKANVIKKIQQDGFKVMMVGDGVNDSIALTLADVGVGIAKGSDVALTSSDFILMNSNLMDILSILKISKRIRININFNLIWAFGYNIIFMPLAAGAFATLGFILNPMYCSLLMAASSVCVCLNSLTLFIYKKK